MQTFKFIYYFYPLQHFKIVYFHSALMLTRACHLLLLLLLLTCKLVFFAADAANLLKHIFVSVWERVMTPIFFFFSLCAQLKKYDICSTLLLLLHLHEDYKNVWPVSQAVGLLLGAPTER